jgi:hypothetical protein
MLQAQLPHRQPTSNNHLTPVEKALAFTQGLLGAARKLTQVAYLLAPDYLHLTFQLRLMADALNTRRRRP